MSEFGAAVDDADRRGLARGHRPQRVGAKFFSAGADVKRFLDGDVAANMEMIRRQPGRVPPHGRGARGLHRPHRRPRARRRARDRARLRRPPRHRRPLQARDARGDARAAARQRRHPAAHPADRRRPGAMELLLTGRHLLPEEAHEWGLVAAVLRARGRRGPGARLRAALRHRAGAGHSGDQALRARGRRAAARRRARARGAS